MNLSTVVLRTQTIKMMVFGSLVPFFKKKYEWPKFGSLDRILVTKNIFLLKNWDQSSIPNFGRFWGFKKFWACEKFIFSYFITCIHSFIQSHSHNTFMHRHSLRPLSFSSSLVCSVGKHLPVVPSRESNSGLPALQQADALPTEPRLTIMVRRGLWEVLYKGRKSACEGRMSRQIWLI